MALNDVIIVRGDFISPDTITAGTYYWSNLQIPEPGLQGATSMFLIYELQRVEYMVGVDGASTDCEYFIYVTDRRTDLLGGFPNFGNIGVLWSEGGVTRRYVDFYHITSGDGRSTGLYLSGLPRVTVWCRTTHAVKLVVSIRAAFRPVVISERSYTKLRAQIERAGPEGGIGWVQMGSNVA